jgi:hypothetical protein
MLGDNVISNLSPRKAFQHCGIADRLQAENSVYALHSGMDRDWIIQIAAYNLDSWLAQPIRSGTVVPNTLS